VREDVYKKYRSKAKEKVDPTLFPQLSILGDGADYQPATSQKLFFFSFSLDVVCYLHTPTYKAKMLKKEEKTKEKKKKPLAVDDSFYVRTLLSQQSTPDSVTLSLCASNTYKNTRSIL
jgi:hypothetical protein